MLLAVPAAAAVAVPVDAVGAPATAAGGGGDLLVAALAGCLTAVRRGMDGGGISGGPLEQVPPSCPAALAAAAVLTPLGTENGIFGTA